MKAMQHFLQQLQEMKPPKAFVKLHKSIFKYFYSFFYLYKEASLGFEEGFDP